MYLIVNVSVKHMCWRVCKLQLYNSLRLDIQQSTCSNFAFSRADVNHCKSVVSKAVKQKFVWRHLAEYLSLDVFD